MKTFICVSALLFFASHITYGQLSLRIFNYRPTGEFGFAMKPLVSMEIGTQGRFSKRATKRTRVGFSATFLKMEPRLEVFPTYGVVSDGAGTRVLPGVQAFGKYNVFQLFGGMDYAFLHNEKYNVYAGIDLIAGVISVDYTDYVESWKDESYSGGGILAGFRFRLGIEYNLTDQISAFIDANRQGFLVAEPRALNDGNDYGLGLRYTFD